MIAKVIDDTYIVRRVTDMAMGAYAGEFNVDKPFNEQEGFDAEPAMCVRCAVSKTFGISLDDLPKMGPLTVKQFGEAIKDMINAPLKDNDDVHPTSSISAEVQGLQTGSADERRESGEGPQQDK